MDGSHSDIAIIGAGMAGLSCASHLAKAGQLVRVFDKGRGPGGRMAARRAEVAGETVSFDHGAQYFTARDPAFRKQVDLWEAQGHAARWAAASASDEDPAFVGTPGMNGPIRAMSQGLEVEWSTRAERIVRSGKIWRIETAGQTFSARIIASAIPAEQAAALLHEPAPHLAAIAQSVVSEPCWALMAGFDQPIGVDGEFYRANSGAIAWAARNSAKPARTGTECWVIHASPSRSRELLETDGEKVACALLADFAREARVDMPEPIHLAAHRWLYAQPESLEGEAARFDPSAGLGLAGDYLHSPRVEGAWLSGRALARAILARA